jgi:hypothetical protein
VLARLVVTLLKNPRTIRAHASMVLITRRRRSDGTPSKYEL